MLSGSWDKTVVDWDLNTGKTIRKFGGSGGQISAIETRPLSTLPVPEASGNPAEPSSTFLTNNSDKPRPNGIFENGDIEGAKNEISSSENAANGDGPSPNDSLFVGNDVDSLFEDNDNEAGGAPSGGTFLDDDDDFSRAIANGMREQEEQEEQERANQDAGGDTLMPDADQAPTAMLVNGDLSSKHHQKPELAEDRTASQEAPSSTGTLTNGLPHAEELLANGHTSDNSLAVPEEAPPTSDSTFLAAAHDGSLRVWDKRQPNPIAKISPQNVPPWCTSAVWSPDGNFIYAGRRNGTVDEYSLHKGLRSAERSFKLPNNSGAVSTLRAMPNGRHLIW